MGWATVALLAFPGACYALVGLALLLLAAHPRVRAHLRVPAALPASRVRRC